MRTYKTPGVYAEEVSTFPPSVAEVSTAVPAFLGYAKVGKSVARISSMLEFEEKFGATPATPFAVTTTTDSEGKEILGTVKPTLSGVCPKFLLNYAVSHYFKNGGGPCYIFSIGDYSASPKPDDFLNGLGLLNQEDEPTLIVMPDAVNLSAADFFSVCQAALAQCDKLKDRFLILDVPNGNVDNFRSGIGTNYLSYGAAYHPYLSTSLTFAYDEATVQVQVTRPATATTATATTTTTPTATTTTPTATATATATTSNVTLAELKRTNTGLYNQIKDALSKQRVTLPPSAAIAGVYAGVDRSRGVWKAPANVSIASVVGVAAKITDEQQENLNIDPTAGKSINAIRDFTGKGVLVWGARTLAGNDNEWRYVSVRRLFITIEESTRKASAFAVFEPNDATTWLKVKGMIDSYLYSLWSRGALAGATPEAAYYTHVGLGKTMTPQDVLEGRLIVEIGIAAVRPAEFIVLRFMHKLQES